MAYELHGKVFSHEMGKRDYTYEGLYETGVSPDRIQKLYDRNRTVFIFWKDTSPEGGHWLMYTPAERWSKEVDVIAPELKALMLIYET